MKITVDGPAASGKSAVAKAVSRKLSIPYLETGLAYRATGFLLKGNLKVKEKISWERIRPLLKLLEIKPLIGETKILIEGKEVGEILRSEEVGRWASLVGTVPEFREYINDVFRDVSGECIVAEGRDAGTNIFPDAQVKIFITASPEVRAKRRLIQLKDMGIQADYEEILAKISERDKRDSTRDKYPFKPAPDAVVIDTSDLTLEETLQKVFSVIREKLGL